jgi:hypothetical protein
MNLILTIRPRISETCNRGISHFKKGYQPRTNIVKDDLFTDSHSILARLSNHFSQLFIDMGIMILGKQIHTVEPLVSEPSALRLRWLLKN